MTWDWRALFTDQQRKIIEQAEHYQRTTRDVNVNDPRLVIAVLARLMDIAAQWKPPEIHIGRTPIFPSDLTDH